MSLTHINNRIQLLDVRRTSERFGNRRPFDLAQGKPPRAVRMSKDVTLYQPRQLTRI
ncbi:hypothetical protein CKA32_001587 [Geitlerinema sp. FC II]|nr:hypothetical protein CKA32_001587 [Geitlerinema sp. FC II]